MIFRLGNGLLNRSVLPCFIFKLKIFYFQDKKKGAKRRPGPEGWIFYGIPRK